MASIARPQGPMTVDVRALSAELDTRGLRGEVLGLDRADAVAYLEPADRGMRLDFTLLLSSTAAMLTELEKATDAKKDIVVTMWEPFRANLEFPIKALDDRKGGYGKPETLHVLPRKGFEEDQMDEDQCNTLGNLVVNDFGEGKEKEAAAAWLKKNPHFGTALAAHLKS